MRSFSRSGQFFTTSVLTKIRISVRDTFTKIESRSVSLCNPKEKESHPRWVILNLLSALILAGCVEDEDDNKTSRHAGELKTRKKWSRTVQLTSSTLVASQSDEIKAQFFPCFSSLQGFFRGKTTSSARSQYLVGMNVSIIILLARSNLEAAKPGHSEDYFPEKNK